MQRREEAPYPSHFLTKEEENLSQKPPVDYLSIGQAWVTLKS